MFARRLYNLDRIIDINANAQKTPVLVQASEKQRLVLLNVYKEFDGNAPVIFGDKNLDINGLKVFSTNAPYNCDKLYQLKTQVWNEALTYLGISNVNIQKKERLITPAASYNLNIDSVETSDAATVYTFSLADSVSVGPRGVNFTQTSDLTTNGIAVQKYGALIIPHDKVATAVTLECDIGGAHYKAEEPINSSTATGDILTIRKQ